MASNHHYFYVLYCQDHTLYAGYTNDLDQRIARHNSGKGAKYTRPSMRRPVRLIYAESWPDKSCAMRQEYRFKQLSRSQKMDYLKQHGLDDLSVSKAHIIVGEDREGEIDGESTK